MIQAKSTIRNIRVSPKKMVLLANAIKGKDIVSAEWIIKSSGKGYAEYLLHALTNAESIIKEKGALNNEIVVNNVEINQGPRLKRHRAGARGYSNNYKHSLSHLTLTLASKENKAEKEKPLKKESGEENKIKKPKKADNKARKNNKG